MRNEISINRAYQETRKERKQAEAKPPQQNHEAQHVYPPPAQVPPEGNLEDEEREVPQADDAARTFTIPDAYYNALIALGGSVTEHLHRAIYVYLSTCQEERIEILRDNGYDEELFPTNDEDDQVDAHGSESANEDTDQESDEEEYFDPDNYETD